MRSITIRRGPIRALGAAIPVALFAGLLAACTSGSTSAPLDLSSVDKVKVLTCEQVRAASDSVGRLDTIVTPGERASGLRALGLDPDNVTQATAVRDAIKNRVTECATQATSAPTTSAPSATSADPETAAVAEAQEWVRMMVVRFQGVTSIPAECQAVTFAEKLTVPEWYHNRPNKESVASIGPNMGSTPCEISKNFVEVLFRDPSFSVLKLNSTGVETRLASEQNVLATQLYGGPFADRLNAARKVLNWYLKEGNTFNIDQQTGPYLTNLMTDGANSGSPLVVDGASNRDSTVLTTTDANGSTVKEDRTNCGGQDMGDFPDHVTPPKPGEDVPVTELQPKVAGQDINLNDLTPVIERVKPTQSATASASQPSQPATPSTSYSTPATPSPSTSASGSTPRSSASGSTSSASPITVDPVQTHTAVPSPTTGW